MLMFDQGGEETIKVMPRSVQRNIMLSRPKNYSETMQLMRWLAVEGHHGFEAVCVDSLTTFYDHVMASVLSLPIKGEGSATQTYTTDMETSEARRVWPILADWGLAGERLRQFVLNCTRMETHFFASAHIDMEKDEVRGQFVYAPALPGKSALRIPLLFSAYVQCRSEPRGGEVVYELVTQPDGLMQAGVRTDGLPTLISPDLPGMYDQIKSIWDVQNTKED